MSSIWFIFPLSSSSRNVRISSFICLIMSSCCSNPPSSMSLCLGVPHALAGDFDLVLLLNLGGVWESESLLTGWLSRLSRVEAEEA